MGSIMEIPLTAAGIEPLKTPQEERPLAKPPPANLRFYSFAAFWARFLFVKRLSSL